MQFEVSHSSVDERMPLIYMWEIRDSKGVLVGRYVGKSKGGASRPRKQYVRNVKNILAGKPYRKSKPDAYRKIHRALAEAHINGYSIVLSFLCNAELAKINEAEQEWIRTHKCHGEERWQLNG